MKKAMNVIITIIFAAGFLTAAVFIRYKPDSGIYQDMPLQRFVEHFNFRVQQLMSRYVVPGVNIALIRNGEIVYLKAYGEADLESGP